MNFGYSDLNKAVSCPRCGWRDRASEILGAPRPFMLPYVRGRCPKCRYPGDLCVRCDKTGCANVAIFGIPTTTGYRMTCFKHLRHLTSYDY